LLGQQSNTRGKINCDLFGLQSSSAHCMTSSSVKYQSFQLRESLSTFQIKITILKNGAQIAQSILSPSTLSVNVNNILFTLQGDFTPYLTPQSLSNQILFIPYLPANDPLVLGGSKNWMIIDSSKVDNSGLSCNKIGTSYTAFRNQPNRCEVEQNSCLKNQIIDFHKVIYFSKKGREKLFIVLW
jgi:hypothetical protein